MIISFSDWAFFTSPYSFTVLAGVVGLLIGSFLNVVIYRLPILMQRQWREECIEFLKLPQDEEAGEIFKQITSSKMSCPPARMELENDFLYELNDYRSIVRNGDQLLMIGADREVLSFTQRSNIAIGK